MKLEMKWFLYKCIGSSLNYVKRNRLKIFYELFLKLQILFWLSRVAARVPVSQLAEPDHGGVSAGQLAGQTLEEPHCDSW